ncbi:MAG: PilN domain-containing protein [Acidobacteriota bacterium]|nr:PilN domain-containing protein [Acidobacteriota bacterium]
MRVPINLSREPFRRDRPVMVASLAAAALLVISLAILLSAAVAERQQSAQTRATLDAVNKQLTRMRAEQVRLDAQMRQPANAVVLDRSILINDLIRRKSISWTRIFSDLQTVLPPTVRITVIRPQVNSRDELSLDMTVESESPDQVIAFISKLEGSDVFGSTEVSTFSPPTQNDAFYHYRLSVNYAQKL